MAGKRTTAESFGVGRGISRVPRIGGHGPLSGSAAFAPGTVSGRMAFPPVTSKTLVKQINQKEKRLALRAAIAARSEEHTSELQSQSNLVCRLLLEKKKKTQQHTQQEHTSGVLPHAILAGRPIRYECQRTSLRLSTSYWTQIQYSTVLGRTESM